MKAKDFYLSVFKNTKNGACVIFPEDTLHGQKKGDVMFSDFMLEDMYGKEVEEALYCANKNEHVS